MGSGLFKFTKMEYIQSALEYGLFASSINNMNDPYEVEGIYYPDDYRICCATRSSTQMLMWAYYAGHKGCCIEFEVPESYEGSILKAVDYRKEVINRGALGEKEVIESLFIKGDEWSHEKEWRAVCHLPDADRSIWIIQDTLPQNVYLNLRVKSITFGLFAEQDEERYRKSLLAIDKYNRQHHTKVQVKKVMMDNDKYELRRNYQFNFEKELTRIKL